MKKKIYLGLFILILCFLAGAIFISKSIDSVTDKLETIITLHKVGFLRESLLNKIIVVQGDLLLKDTPHSTQVDTFIQHAVVRYHISCVAGHIQALEIRIKRQQLLVKISAVHPRHDYIG